MVGYRNELVGRLINEYKFGLIRALAKPLAEMMDEVLPDLPDDTIIVPLPTISRHIRERGFDHTRLLAKRLAKIRGWRVGKILGRAENTVQVGANERLRKEQARKAYEVCGRVDPNNHYLVIDDVWTTGASMEAACRVLRSAGARSIDVAVLARNRRID